MRGAKFTAFWGSMKKCARGAVTLWRPWVVNPLEGTHRPGFIFLPTRCLAPLLMCIRNQSMFFLSIFASFAMSACLLHVDVGSGNLTTRGVEVPTFDRVTTRNFLDVQVASGAVQAVAVTCDDNLQEHIDVFVDKGTLVLQSMGSLNIHASSGCKVQVTVPALRAAATLGSGNLQIAGLPCHEMHLETHGSGDIYYEGQCSQLRVQSSGSGDVRLQGRSQSLNLQSRGSGDIDAGVWVAQDVSAQTLGSGDVSLNAQRSVVATSLGSGDIKISGPAPKRHIKSQGSGDISFH